MSSVGPARAGTGAAGASASTLVWLRSWVFAAGQWLSVLIWAPVCLGSVLLPYRSRYQVMLVWCRFIRWWLRACCRVHVEIEGREHIPDQPCIVFCRHESAWETLTLPLLFVPQTWVLKRELLKIPLFGWTLATMRPIAIDRGNRRQAIRQIIDQGRRRLAQGLWVVVFPEGTRVAPSAPVRFRQGGALLAAESGIPVLPVALNSGDHWVNHSALRRPGTIRVVVCPPVRSADRRAADILADSEARVREAMVRLRPELGRNRPDSGSGPS